jgi:hypothetical protein
MQIQACLPLLLPVHREGSIAWILPIVEDLVDDLGDHLRPCVLRSVQGFVERNDVGLLERDA